MIFGFLPQNLKTKAVAVAFIMSWREDEDGADRGMARLAGFRGELYCSLGMRRDVLFEVADALACRQERVLMLAELCLEPECRRGHGGGLRRAELRGGPRSPGCGGRCRRSRCAAWDDGRIRLACDVSNWLRPDAETSPERLFCHCYARGKGNAQLIPGWPYSFVVALEPGRTSWTLPLDAVRLGPADDATEVTAAQVRDVVARIIAAGHWKPGDPDIIAVFDSGYDLTRLAWLLGGLPLDVTGRLRSDRVMYFPVPPREPGATGRAAPARGRAPARATRRPGRSRRRSPSTETSRYGTATATAWARLHQRLERRAGWERHEGELPVVEGTLIRLQVDHLPGCRDADPVWLWSSRAGTARGGSEPGLAGVPAPLRYRAHVPVPQAAARLDPPEAPRPGRRRPLDLARHRRLRPAAPRPRRSPPTSGCPGSSPARPAASPPPGSAAGSAASARTCPFPPARRNPPGPDPDARPARRTAGPPPATTSARPSSAKNRRRRPSRQTG